MITTAKAYHHTTSYHRHDMHGHRLDWASQPSVHKVYRGMEYLRLPRPENLPQLSLQEAATPLDQVHGAPVALDRLSVLFALAYGITGHTRSGAGDFYYRSAPSAGALYPVEIYLAAGNIDGLPSGLYHYDTAGLGLCRLRSGNVMASADRCLPGDAAESPADAVFLLTAIFFRSSWKYRKRAFRYVLLDTGHVLENLAMSLKAEGIVAEIHYDIEKNLSDRFLGCDPRRETCFAAVRVPGIKSYRTDSPEAPASLPRDIIEAGRVSEKEEQFEEILQISLAASKLPTHDATPSDMTAHIGVLPGRWQPLEKTVPDDGMDFTRALIHRRSGRNYVPTELPRKTFLGLLNTLCLSSKRRQPPSPPYGTSLATGLLVQNVEHMAPGFYLCDFANDRWGLVREGKFIRPMAGACLDQAWLQNAAVHVCFLADLDRLDKTWGARGYQYAMLEAGRIGEGIYLGATALGLGCCGIGALYDDEAKTLLGLNDSSALLYLVAVGPVKAKRKDQMSSEQ